MVELPPFKEELGERRYDRSDRADAFNRESSG